MPGRAALRQIEYADEASFAQYADAIGSATYSTGVPVLSEPTLSLPQPRIPDASMMSRANDRRPSFKGPRDLWTLEFETYWPGHMLASTGAMTENWAFDLLADGLGGGNSGDTGTTISTGATTTSLPVTLADFVAGSVVRASSGYAARVRTLTGSTLNLHTTLGATPANGSAVYATMQAYPVQTSTITTKRFLVAYEDTGAQFALLGGTLTGLTLLSVVGDMPRMRWRYQGGYWKRSAVSFPTATVLPDDLTAHWSNGQVFFSPYSASAAANANLAVSRIELAVNIETHWQRTTGGLVNDQVITGVTRGRITPTCSMTIPSWSTAYDTLWDSDGSSSTYYTIINQNQQSTDGRVVGWVMPYAFIDGERPTITSDQGVNAISFTMTGREWSLGATDLAKAPLQFFQG